MTANFKQFKQFVNDKFGSLSNFAKIATGSFQTYKGLEALSDEEENYWKIYSLIKLAKKTDFDVEKVEISDFEREAIKARMDYFLFEEDYKNVSAVLREKGISHVYYSAVIHGRMKRKNLAYERLIKDLGL